MPQPGLALVLFLLGSGVLVLLAWPRWGLVARLLRVVRLTERVRVEDALKHLITARAWVSPVPPRAWPAPWRFPRPGPSSC